MPYNYRRESPKSMAPEALGVDNLRCHIIIGERTINVWHLRLLKLKTSDAILSLEREPQIYGT